MANLRVIAEIKPAGDFPVVDAPNVSVTGGKRLDVALSEAAAEVAKKANKSEVDAALASKANKSEVDAALASKANKSEVDTALAGKANKSEVDAAIENKADKSAFEAINASVSVNTSNIQELSTESTVLSARMDEFTKLEEGSTTGDAELADGRVGADGKTYDNIGGAIRGQVTDLKSDLSEVEAEVQNLRIGADGTSYPTAKARVDVENYNNNEDIQLTNDKLNELLKTEYTPTEINLTENKRWTAFRGVVEEEPRDIDKYYANVAVEVKYGEIVRIHTRTSQTSLEYDRCYYITDVENNVLKMADDYSEATFVDLIIDIPRNAKYLYVNSYNSSYVTIEIGHKKSIVDSVEIIASEMEEGQKDNSFYINELIANAPEGSTIIIPHGVFKCNINIRRSNITLKHQGMTNFVGSFLEPFDTLKPVIQLGDDEGEMVRSVMITGVTISGESTGDGIAVYHARDIYIKNASVRRGKRDIAIINSMYYSLDTVRTTYAEDYNIYLYDSSAGQIINWTSIATASSNTKKSLYSSGDVWISGGWMQCSDRKGIYLPNQNSRIYFNGFKIDTDNSNDVVIEQYKQFHNQIIGIASIDGYIAAYSQETSGVTTYYKMSSTEFMGEKAPVRWREKIIAGMSESNALRLGSCATYKITVTTCDKVHSPYFAEIVAVCDEEYITSKKNIIIDGDISISFVNDTDGSFAEDNNRRILKIVNNRGDERYIVVKCEIIHMDRHRGESTVTII